MQDMTSGAVWLMFSLWMYSGNHYIVGSIALVISLLMGYINRNA